jgi:hypothetical protein
MHFASSEGDEICEGDEIFAGGVYCLVNYIGCAIVLSEIGPT